MSRKKEKKYDPYLRLLDDVEAQMQNEVVVLNFDNSAFCKGIRKITGQRTSQKAALKTLAMLKGYYRKNGIAKGAKRCDLESEHIKLAASKGFLQKQYPNLNFSDPVKPDGKPGPLEKYQNRMLFLFCLINTLIAAAILAFAVLALHLNFWFFWIICFVLMGLADYWVVKHLVPHMVFSRLEKETSGLKDRQILTIHKNYIKALGRKQIGLKPAVKE